MTNTDEWISVFPIMRLYATPAISTSDEEEDYKREDLTDKKIKIYILSADSGITWNPFCKEFPSEDGEWVFATPSIPRIIALETFELCFFVIHSKSQKSRYALREILNDIIKCGADKSKVACVAGGMLLDTCAATVAKFNVIFPSFENIKECNSVKVFTILSTTKPTFEFEKAEDPMVDVIKDCRWSSQNNSLLFSSRLKSHLLSFWPNGDEFSKKISSKSEELSLEDMSPEILAASDIAVRSVIAAAKGSIIILTGSTGVEIEDAANRILMASSSDIRIVKESEMIRIRAGIINSIESLKADLLKGNITIVVSAPCPRRNDREIFSYIANSVGAPPVIIAWVTRPGWWRNIHDTDDPETSHTIRANAIQFEPPDNDGSGITVLRIV